MFSQFKYLFFSILSGLALGLAWPTNGFTLLIFISLIPLLYLEQLIRNDFNDRKAIRIFCYSYLSFLIWNLITTWWLYNSTIYGMLFANFCNSLFYSIIFLLFYWVKSRMPLRSAYIFFSCCWLAFEKLHLTWDFSWSWLNLGNVFSEKTNWIQWYEYTGTFGGSLWVLILNIWIYEIIKSSNFKKLNFSIKKTIGPILFIVIPIIFSIYLSRQIKYKGEKIQVVIMQPNIDPYNSKYQISNISSLENFIKDSKAFISNKTSYVINPETFFAEGYGEELSKFKSSILHKEIQKILYNYPNLEFITGIQFFNKYYQEKPPSLTANLVRENLWLEFYNSALSEQFEKEFEVYHKSKLVVGVENMPFKNFLKPLLGDVLINLGGTVSSRVTQNNRSVFNQNSLSKKIAPIICYESIFGEFVTGFTKKGANFFAILTNDAWGGETPGHKQLLSYSRLRAIENRRDIVRSANTRLSAIISARGEIIKKTKYNTKTVLVGEISPRSELTFYSIYGDLIGRWAIFISGILLLIAISGRLKKI